MLNLWGIPGWAFLLFGGIVAGSTWWRVRRGTVSGPLSVVLSALSTAADSAGFLALVALHLSVLGFQLMIVLTLSSWLLGASAKRAKKFQGPQAAI